MRRDVAGSRFPSAVDSAILSGLDYVNDPLYVQLKALRRGELKLPEVHRDFLERLREEFKIDALHVGIDTESQRRSGQQFMNIVVQRRREAERLDRRSDKPAMAAAFLELLRSNTEPPIPGFEVPAAEELTGLRVYFCAVERVAALEASRKLGDTGEDLTTELQKAFPTEGISSVDTLADNHHIIRYHTTAQEKANLANGVNARILAELLRRLRVHDPFGWISDECLQLEFISDETLKRDHGGGTAFYR